MSMKKNLLSSLLIFPFSVLAIEPPLINELEYDLDNIEALSFSLEHADIHIEHDDSNHVSIIHKQVLKDGDADKCLYQLNKKSKSTSLHIYNERNSSDSSFFNFGSFGSCSVEQKIRITIGNNIIEKLKLNFSHSNAKLDHGHNENLKLNVAHSKVTIDNIEVNKASIHLAHSKINIDTLIAKKVNFEGAHGLLHINKVKSNITKGDWAHGKITLMESDIKELSLDTAHSGVSLNKHKGESVNIDGSHSHIYANTSITENATLENRHGPITFIGMPQKMHVSNAHGGINLTQLLNDTFDITAKNRHGSIVLSVPEGSEYSYYLNNNGSEIERENSSENSIKLSASHGHTKIKEF